MTVTPISYPTLIQAPFAYAGVKNVIPTPSSSPQASLYDGFPPVTMQPLASGGVPPDGHDMNGILNLITQHTTFLNGGGNYLFSSGLAALIGGYAIGATVQSNDGTKKWVSTVAGNVQDPNAGPIAITASTATNQLTVSATSGILAVGQFISGAGIPYGVYISALGTGTGGNGTYTLSATVGTIASESMTASGWQPWSGSLMASLARLADTSVNSNGPALVGMNTALTYPVNTVGNILAAAYAVTITATSTPTPSSIPKSDTNGYITEQWIGTDIRRFWSCLAPVKAAGGNGGSLVVLGDSISEGYGASNAATTSWVSLLRNALFGASGENCGDMETVVSFFGLTQYGLTYGGTYAQGSAGPTKQSIILQPGATITFTGNYDYIDVFYTQSAGGGTLLFLKDAVQYKSLSTAGTATPDACTFPSATGGGGTSHTYTLQASGTAVEITGLIRLMTASNPTGPQGRVHLTRQAITSVSSSYYAGAAATLASITKQGAFFTAPSLYLICLGTNNIYNNSVHTSVAQYEADLRTICTAIKAANLDNKIMLWVPPVANETIWTPFAPWGQYSQAVRRVSADYGAGIIDLGSIDLVGRGLTADGVHPNDTGHFLIYQRVMQSIANYMGFKDDGNVRTAWTPAFGRLAGTLAVGYSLQSGWYTRTPDTCTFSANLTLNSMTSDGTGYLYVTLPFPSAATQYDSFVVGQHALAGTAGYQILCETIPGTNRAIVRSFNPASGAYNEIGTLTATSNLCISGTYAI